MENKITVGDRLKYGEVTGIIVDTIDKETNEHCNMLLYYDGHLPFMLSNEFVQWYCPIDGTQYQMQIIIKEVSNNTDRDRKE